jgi:hypothetical protein
MPGHPSRFQGDSVWEPGESLSCRSGLRSYPAGHGAVYCLRATNRRTSPDVARRRTRRSCGRDRLRVRDAQGLPGCYTCQMRRRSGLICLNAPATIPVRIRRPSAAVLPRLPTLRAGASLPGADSAVDFPSSSGGCHLLIHALDLASLSSRPVLLRPMELRAAGVSVRTCRSRIESRIRRMVSTDPTFPRHPDLLRK